MCLITTDNLCFIHIPKCAGTSVKAVLNTKADNNYNNKQLYDRHPSWQDILNTVGQKKYNTLYKFSIVRHPIDIFKSWYRYIRKHNTVKNDIKRLINQQNKSIEYVIDSISENKHLAQQVPILSQHTFIYNDNECMINYIFKYENLSEVNTFLTNRGYKKLPCKNKTKQHEIILNNIYKEKIYELSIQDFKKFGYHFI